MFSSPARGFLLAALVATIVTTAIFILLFDVDEKERFSIDESGVKTDYSYSYLEPRIILKESIRIPFCLSSKEHEDVRKVFDAAVLEGQRRQLVGSRDDISYPATVIFGKGKLKGKLVGKWYVWLTLNASDEYCAVFSETYKLIDWDKY